MKRFNLPTITILLLLVIGVASCQSHETGDLIIHNGPIYTVDESQPKVEAVVVKDQRIAFAGKWNEAKKWQSDKTTILDLNGSTMTPGLIEGHGHFMGMGYSKLQLDLLEVKSYDELVAMVEQAVKEAKPGEWITGRGWHQSKWSLPEGESRIKGFQTHEKLSKISPNNPVWLKHASGHAGFANAEAMRIAGVSNLQMELEKPEDGESGEVIKDQLGNPTGIFNERAQEIITKHIPEGTPEIFKKAFDLAVKEAISHGITSFQDAGVRQSEIDLFKQSADNGDLKLRLWCMLSGTDSVLLNNWYQSGPLVDYQDKVTVRAIKLYMDGALGSRGAWLLDEYEDRKGHYGHETTEMETVFNVSQKGLEHGFQVCSHAIGDRANREVLDNYEKAFKENPEKATNSRFRIEHAQHISEEDIPRFGEMGVIASMQAIHMSSDRPWAIDRLGINRIKEGAYVWRKLKESGAVVTNGTDVPVEPINPIASFYAQVTRKTLAGTPEGGYEADQKLSRMEALKAYTLDCAYAAFEEEIKGSIEQGKLADFTIFDQDIIEVFEDSLLNTQILKTIVNGEIVYEKNSY